MKRYMPRQGKRCAFPSDPARLQRIIESGTPAQRERAARWIERAVANLQAASVEWPALYDSWLRDVARLRKTA